MIFCTGILKTNEQLTDSGEADNLPVSIDVPAINEEEQFGVIREDPPKSPDESVANEEHRWVGSAEADPSFTTGSPITIIQQFGVSREDLPITTDAPMDDPSETDSLHVSIGVPATNEEEEFDVSREDLPKTTDAPLDDSSETGNLPVIIGVWVAILLVVVVISVILYKEKLCSKLL
jgi:hypothetical protein